VPHAIARADGEMLAFAELWEGWRASDGDVLRTFAIITTDANEQMSTLHCRMPVILEQTDWPLWLGETDSDAEMLLRPAPEGILPIWQRRSATSGMMSRSCWNRRSRRSLRTTGQIFWD
jgi:putative SOS response-associated peptidase YedK